MTLRDEDESFSWKAASLVMLLVSSLILSVRFVFNTPFFNTAFEVALVYVPTAVLVSVWLRDRKTGEP